MTFSEKLRWGRTDPVTKTLSEIEDQEKGRFEVAAKRMMAKRGDDVAKAFAGSPCIPRRTPPWWASSTPVPLAQAPMCAVGMENQGILRGFKTTLT